MSVFRRATVMLIMFHLFSEIMFESFNIPGLYIAVQVRFIILFCSKLVLIPILQSFVFSIEKLITVMITIMMKWNVFNSKKFFLVKWWWWYYYYYYYIFIILYYCYRIFHTNHCILSLLSYFHTNPDIFKTAHCFTQIGLPSTQNEWICSLKLHWFETALGSSLRPCS